MAVFAIGDESRNVRVGLTLQIVLLSQTMDVFMLLVSTILDSLVYRRVNNTQLYDYFAFYTRISVK